MKHETRLTRCISGTLQGAGGVGGLLAVKRNGVWYAPLYDANGNVTAYVSETGAVVAEYEYDAFGATISQSGMMADTFRHRFSTKPWIAALGAYDYGERLYSPELRRWLSRDPIEEEGGANLYAMCGNDAVNLVDMLGMTDGFSSAIQQDKFIKIESKIAKYKKPWYRYVFKSPFLDIDISAKNKIILYTFSIERFV